MLWERDWEDGSWRKEKGQSLVRTDHLSLADLAALHGPLSHTNNSEFRTSPRQSRQLTTNSQRLLFPTGTPGTFFNTLFLGI